MVNILKSYLIKNSIITITADGRYIIQNKIFSKRINDSHNIILEKKNDDIAKDVEKFLTKSKNRAFDILINDDFITDIICTLNGDVLVIHSEFDKKFNTLETNIKFSSNNKK